MDEDSPAEFPRDRASARLQGGVKYFTGKPCSQGHLAPRYTTNGHCVVCVRRQLGAWQEQRTDVCSIEGCGRPVYGRGWCHAHNARWRKTGDARADVPIEARTERSGPEARCGVDGCEKPRKSRGWCSTHWQRWKKHGDPLYVPDPPPVLTACRAEGCDREPAQRGFCWSHYSRLLRYGSPDGKPDRGANSQVTYYTLHARLRRARGSATARQCVGECGRQARQWAWLHGEDPCDFGNYVPMCYSCHKRYDGSPDDGIQPWGIGLTPKPRRRRPGGPPLPLLLAAPGDGMPM
jgi:hypothetical protein